ncbi:hypothetical protein ACLF3G_02890 [Falsiroseomonas sp. HC035]|uniref:hypothetical protein n=1 Tax=Falsiroseomonas sp. HC035 TaxID=3390999 RepID=UPI003D30F600
MAAFDVIREGMQLYPPSYIPGRGADYLYSPSRLYFAVLEENGDFNVYRGETPEDPARILVWSNGASARMPSGHVVTVMVLRAGPFDHGTKNLQIFSHDPNRGSTLRQLWASGGSSNLASPMVAMLGDDGSVVVRQDDHDVWTSGFSDPVGEFLVEQITYDAPRGTIQADNEVDVLEESVTNNGDVSQSMKMARSTISTVTSNWSKTHSAQFTIGGELQVTIPGVGHAKVTSSTSVTDTFTFGETRAKATSIGFEFPLVVPAHKTYRGWASVREAKFEVPYTVFGELHFRSGAKVKHAFSGTYQGKTGYMGTFQIDDVTPASLPSNTFFCVEGPAAGIALLPEESHVA